MHIHYTQQRIACVDHGVHCQSRLQRLVKDFTTRDVSDEDLSTIQVLVHFWATVVYEQGAWEWILPYRSWHDWPAYLKLIGPLEVGEALSDFEMTLVTNMIKLNVSQGGDSFWQTLDEISATMLDCSHTFTPPRMIKYLVGCLCTYLWIHEYSAQSDRMVGLLAHLISLPVDIFDYRSPPTIWTRLFYCSLYSVVFGLTNGVYKCWADRHPVMDFPQLGNNAKSILAFHSAIKSQVERIARFQSRFRSKVILIRIWLHDLGRCLAYTPHPQPDDNSRINRAKSILSKINRLLLETRAFVSGMSPALSSLIWIPKMSHIPRIHEYLEFNLTVRQNFPNLRPVWRDWGSYWERPYLGLTDKDNEWFESMKDDRMLVEVLLSFDKLVSDGCSARQHLILVQLAINDLRGEAPSPHYSCYDPRYVYYGRDEKCDPDYRDYYTEERKRQLIKLQDPALRLVAARAAGMPYTGVLPSRRDSSGQMDAWNEAMEFWC